MSALKWKVVKETGKAVEDKALISAKSRRITAMLHVINNRKAIEMKVVHPVCTHTVGWGPCLW